MSLWSRIVNVVRSDRLNREIDEELESHLAEAVAAGRDPAEARRALGSTLRHRDASRDARIVRWLDALRADAVFGWRQLRKHTVTSAAAVLSLALALGACVSAFRIIDAALLRPLPVAHPDRLYVLVRESGAFSGAHTYDGSEYPLFQHMRAAVKGDAELAAISYLRRVDLTYGADTAMEKANWQYVSGWTFDTFGLHPAAGRLFTERDDVTPGAHPYAVISHDYWTRRFNRDPAVVGRTFRMDSTVYEIVGVVDAPFTGTETGTTVDVFVPAMMHPAVTRDDATWFRTWISVRPGVGLEPLRARLQVVLRAFVEGRAKGFAGMPRREIENYVNERASLASASAGRSDVQLDNARPLAALAVLVALVLLIACANVANLMTAQAASRGREMALRVSIGAGRARLVQLVLVESAWIALLATAAGALFAWWSAPFVVGLINPPDNPVRLALPADWRVLGFGALLTLAVTILFGVAPALRASSVTPVSALKGGEDPHARRGLMHTLIAGQVAFCVLVLFVAGLFVATFQRLTRLPTGFSADRVVTLETVARPGRPAVFWSQVMDRLRAVPGVEAVALTDVAPLVNDATNGFLSIDGGPPTKELAFFRDATPGWAGLLRIPILAGRDLSDVDASPGATLVNETFARTFFRGENPIGRTFARGTPGQRYTIVGLVRDARYRSLREAMLPVAYRPFRQTRADGADVARGYGTFLVRTTSADPLAIAPALREAVARAQPGFRVSTIRTQVSINQQQTVRERLLAMLAAFFAAVALALAGVGLYGVLDYSVLQRRREIGIRLAIGARAADITRRVTARMLAMVAAGALAGLAAGLASARALDALFYDVRATEWPLLLAPAAVMLAVAIVASIAPVIRALRIDPLTMLRTD